MRVNEGEAGDDCFVMRKVARSLEARKPTSGCADQKEKFFSASSATFAATLPMKLDSVYNQAPFNIMSATVMIELTSFIGTNSDNQKFEIMPSFVSHAADLRNLCSVRDWKTDYKLDEMKRWELITPNPTIE